MKYLSCIGLLVASLAAAAPEKTADPKPGDPLLVAMGQRKPVRVRVALGQTTLIRLPTDQKVMNVYGGDKGEGGLWAVDAGKMPTRFLAVKPKEKGIHTTLHVISNTGRELSCFLEEVTGQEEQFDAEVDADSDDAPGSSTTGPEVKWVSSEEVTTCKAHEESLRVEATEATKKAQAQAETAIADFRAQYPYKLEFPYVWDEAKASKLGLERGWTDDKFTYFKANRVLALYEINEDGKASLIQYSYANGLYIVPKILSRGYFAIGGKKENKLEFYRRGKA